MFAAAFSVIDEANGDPRARSVQQRVESGLYNRPAQHADDGLLPVLDMGPARRPARRPSRA